MEAVKTLVDLNDAVIFTFVGFDWRMDLTDSFFINKSQARCKAVVKNAFLDYYKNKDEIRKLLTWMEKLVELEKQESLCPKIMEKFQKVIDYIRKEEEKYAY
jgi:hypothetical protein